jgi:hypothetical protein
MLETIPLEPFQHGIVPVTLLALLQPVLILDCTA